MNCPVCGLPQSNPAHARQPLAARFCPRCGQPVYAARWYAPPEQRVLRNLQPLAIVWLIYGGYRVLMAALTAVAFALFGRENLFGDTPEVFRHLAAAILPMLGIVTLALAVAAILTGIGLLNRAPWARSLAIVMAILALLHPPLGTALGIYTLWVLGPRASDGEWRSLQQA